MHDPLYTAEEMRTVEAGHDVEALMERAGRAVADEVRRRFPHARRVAGVCGKGANGGDTRIALRLLAEAGVEQVDELDRADVVLDGLFGTGFRGMPRSDAAAAIERVNGTGAPVVAVDVPSGVDASTGEVPGAAVRADLTVAFHGPKVGLAVAPGRFHAGEVVVADIGLETGETTNALATREVLARVPRRAAHDNKYSAGSVLVVGGAPGLTGAAMLAARAAFRADAGYVAVAAPAESLPVLETLVPEAVKRPLEDVYDAVAKAGALALGPGLGAGYEALVARLLTETDLPAVVDADGLRGLGPLDRGAPTVLTPHEGELARLLGEETADVRARRLDAVVRAAERFGVVVLLKGADTLIAEPGGAVVVAALGPPSLAVAGSGDVLTGVVAAFLAKGLGARDAAVAGAVAQQVAAAAAGRRAGLVAGDVVEALSEALDAPL